MTKKQKDLFLLDIYIFDSHCHLDYMVSKLNKSRTWSQDDSGIRIYIQDLQWMGRE